MLDSEPVPPQVFEESVKQVVRLKSRLKVLQEESRATRQELAEHKDNVVRYMGDSGVHNVTYKKHQLRYKVSKRKKRPTMKDVKENPQFFSTDAEKNRFLSKFDELTLVDECEALTVTPPKPKKDDEGEEADED